MKKKLIRRAKSYIKRIRPLIKNEMNGYNQIDSDKLSYRTLMPCHTVEKGMALKNYEPGHGKKAVNEVIDRMAEYPEKNVIQNYYFLESVSVIKAWLDIQEKAGVDVSVEHQRFYEQLERFNGLHSEDFFNASEGMAGGAYYLKKDFLIEKTKGSFAEMAQYRRSIRAFSDEAITKEELERVIKIAGYAPSACNRQPVKVYASLDPEKNRTVSGFVPGNKGFEDDIPYYMVVTSNREFFGDGEFCQWFVNGGIAVAYLVLGMFSEKIGSCIFQWPSNYPGENKLKKFCGISEAEAVCAIIGYGKLPEDVKVIGACRKPIDNYLKIF